MKAGLYGALISLMFTVASVGAPPSVLVRSTDIAQVQERYAPLVAAQGRKLVLFDADGLVRPFGDAVLGRTWDTVPRNARGSFERIAAATSERRAFSLLVRVSGTLECRVGPTSPDQAWINLLAAYSGHDRTEFNPGKMALTSAIFQRFVRSHEIGHCTDKHAFDRDPDPIRNLMLRHRAEGYGDVFAILELARAGVSKRALQEIIWIRALYLSASSLGAEADRKDTGSYPSDAAIAGYEHVPYFNIEAMNAAVSIADRVGALNDRQITDLAHRLIEADGVTAADMVLAHRALAKEQGFTYPVAEVIVADAQRELLTMGAVIQGPSDFDRAAWESKFLAKLKKTGSTPEAAIAEERTRLRTLAAGSMNVDGATAVEASLGQLSDLAMKGYAGITDPPETVTSRGSAANVIPVAAIPSRSQDIGLLPSTALGGALKSLTADRRLLLRPLERLKPKAPGSQPVPMSSVRTGTVAKVSLKDVRKSLMDEMTGVSSAIAEIRADGPASLPHGRQR